MSGGAYRYFYSKLKLFADEILEDDNDFDGSKPKPFLETRKEFSSYLHALAKVCKNLEWADSGDISYEDAETQIKEFLSKNKRCLGTLSECSNPDKVRHRYQIQAKEVITPQTDIKTLSKILLSLPDEPAASYEADKEYYGEDSIEDLPHWWETLQLWKDDFSKLSNIITVWRCVAVPRPEIDCIIWDKLGIFWSLEKSGAGEYYSMVNEDDSKYYAVMKGKVKASDVDWLKGLINFMVFPDQKEIQLKSGCSVSIKQVDFFYDDTFKNKIAEIKLSPSRRGIAQQATDSEIERHFGYHT